MADQSEINLAFIDGSEPETEQKEVIKENDAISIPVEQSQLEAVFEPKVTAEVPLEMKQSPAATGGIKVQGGGNSPPPPKFETVDLAEPNALPTEPKLNICWDRCVGFCGRYSVALTVVGLGIGVVLLAVILGMSLVGGRQPVEVVGGGKAVVLDGGIECRENHTKGSLLDMEDEMEALNGTQMYMDDGNETEVPHGHYHVEDD